MSGIATLLPPQMVEKKYRDKKAECKK